MKIIELPSKDPTVTGFHSLLLQSLSEVSTVHGCSWIGGPKPHLNSFVFRALSVVRFGAVDSCTADENRSNMSAKVNSAA